MMPYERLRAWQTAHRLALAVFRVTEGWPREERFGLTAQTKRAAISVPTNLAEGSARRGQAEFKRYIDIARGSLAELGYLLRLAWELGYLTEADRLELDRLTDTAGRQTWRLYSASRKNPSAP